MNQADPVDRTCRLEDLLRRRIVILDGAMGTMIQTYKLDEAGYRGDQFAGHPQDVKGNNDLLCLTRPEIVEAIHRQYLEAGADIIETNTFNSTAISMADYKLEDLVYELNVAGASLARKAADAAMAKDPSRPRFVAGAIGPTNRTASMSPDVNNPAFRAVTYDQLVTAYSEQVRGLMDGGVDVLLTETVFDTLNLKAALFAIAQYFEEQGRRVPIMVSVTITDQSGRTLSGQTIEAFWNSISHMPLLSVGINCALGAKQMRPYLEELAHIAPVSISCYPNAGLPNAFGGFDETPDRMSADLHDFAAHGWLNIVGGCCGSTPTHITAIAEAVRECQPHVPAVCEPHNTQDLVSITHPDSPDLRLATFCRQLLKREERHRALSDALDALGVMSAVAIGARSGERRYAIARMALENYAPESPWLPLLVSDTLTHDADADRRRDAKRISRADLARMGWTCAGSPARGRDVGGGGVA